jgi:hypothetical protein
MPMLPALHVLSIVVLSGLVVGFVGAAVLGVPSVYRTVRAYRGHDGESSRRCRYCRFGRAHLHEETARVEGDDLVEVFCYVCRSCGLPQWVVERSPVLKKAA